jgi:hypothetical protein
MAGYSQGKVDNYLNDPTTVGALMYNMDIGATYLRPHHKLWLDNNVVSRFKGRPANVAIWGWASRSGDPNWNRNIALRRADALAYYLKTRGFPTSTFKYIDGQVDDDPANDPNDEKWRGATVYISTTDPIDWAN